MNTKPCLFKMKLFMPGILLLSLFLVGCKVQAVTTINLDGSGTYRTIMGFTEQEISSFASMDTDIQKLCEDMRAEVEKSSTGQTVTVRIEKQEGMTLCTVETAFANLDELRTIYEQQGQATVNRLEFANNKLFYDITLTSSSAAQSNPDDPAAELGRELGTLLAGTIDATWEVRLPGKVEKNNADRVENNVLIWQFDNTSQNKNMTAESTTGGTWFRYVILILAALMLIILGVTLPSYLQRKKVSSLTRLEGQADVLKSIARTVEQDFRRRDVFAPNVELLAEGFNNQARNLHALEC